MLARAGPRAALPPWHGRGQHAGRTAIFHRRRGRGKEGGVLNLCQMFGGRLLLGNQNPQAECSSVSSNERQQQSCKTHTHTQNGDGFLRGKDRTECHGLCLSRFVYKC